MINESEKEDIKATVDILIQLDKESLRLINFGASLLKARMDMDASQDPEKKVG